MWVEGKHFKEPKRKHEERRVSGFILRLPNGRYVPLCQRNSQITRQAPDKGTRFSATEVVEGGEGKVRRKSNNGTSVSSSASSQ